MIRKSFIEIQIEMFIAALARIILQKERAEYQGAAKEIQQTSRKVAGLDVTVLASMPESSLLAQFTDERSFDAGRCLVIGCLMQEQAEIDEINGQANRAETLQQKATLLLLEALLREPNLRTAAYMARLETLMSQVVYQDLPALTQQKLAAYLELQGSYARAEDVLYALRENGYPQWVTEANAFYSRLLACSDDALIAGGLTRNEIEEALEEVPSAD